jgi:hypothetical protein
MDALALGRLFTLPRLEDSGHLVRGEDHNLGFGWLYYALVRALRPRHVVVIGSLRGFVPIVLGRAMLDNLEGGRVTFIDPSLADDFWSDASAVDAHFRAHGTSNVRHIRLTTQDFVRSEHFERLGPVGLLFVDGLHTMEQARFDHESFLPLLGTAPAVFHDSCTTNISKMYGKQYTRSVGGYIAALRSTGVFDVFELPIAPGVAFVSKRT